MWGAANEKGFKIMKLLGTGILCMVCVIASAADTEVKYETRRDGDRTVVVDHNTDRNWMAYNCNDVEFSLFGSGTLGDDTLRHPSSKKIERDGKLGAGGALAYFFHRNIGIEGYAYSESTGGDHFVDNVGGNVIGRFPIGHSGVAPYILIGGGRQFDPVIQWTVDVGGGIQWRFIDHVAIFVDARYVWADETKDYGLGRLGIKFGF